MDSSTKIFVAGHRGMVGAAITRRLQAGGYTNLLLRTRQELDLSDQAAVHAFYAEHKPDLVILAAALVGGIEANRSRPADFIGQNLAIQQNVVWGAHLHNVPRLMFLGSSCVYPRETPQPIPETAVLTGPPEPTNAPYAIAKISGMVMAESIHRQYGRDYFTVMPPNVYGDGDNFDPTGSHVMAAMIRRFHLALPGTDVTCWGSGNPRREFLHCDDVADAIVFLLEQNDLPDRVYNIGTGTSVSIREVAETVQRVTGHTGQIHWDTTKPDGFPEKTNDVSRLFGLGWQPKIAFEEGVQRAYRWYLDNVPEAKSVAPV